MKELKGHVVVNGTAEGNAIVTGQPFGFFGGVDPTTGIIMDTWHELHGENIKGKVFVFPEGMGSTVGAAIILELVRTGCAPVAMLNNKTEIITAAGGVIAKKFYDKDLPMIDGFDCNIVDEIKTGDYVKILEDGTVIITEKE
ncbi:MAG: DUF126 domain-containing protein [Parasporobacterium sp.]|nr:DUF126 domain-containing protein [Parasporobacterium sp.]